MKNRGALLIAKTCTISDCVCVPADARNETPQCLVGKHTQEGLESWLWSCNEDTAANRESVEIWQRDLTTQRDDVWVPAEESNMVPVEPYTGLKLALGEAHDQKMVLEYNWRWPYCL